MPLARLTLPCEHEPIGFGPDLQLPVKDDAEATLHALAHGTEAPCALLQRALDLLRDEPTLQPTAWWSPHVFADRAWPVPSTHAWDGTALADNLVAMAGDLRPIRSDDARSTNRTRRAFSHLVPSFPPDLQRLVLARAAMPLADPTAWLAASDSLREKVTRLVDGATAPGGLGLPVRIDPWSLGERRDDHIVLPPSWVTTVWGRGAERIDGDLALSLRLTTPDAGVARLVSEAGHERTVEVVHRARWKVRP